MRGAETIDNFILKSKVFFNKQSIGFLREIQGTRAFVVSDSVMDRMEYLQQAIGHLSEAGISSSVFTDVRPDPDVKVVADGMRAYMESGADVLVALGGGSVIDAAKGILYSVWQYHAAEGKKFEKPLFIAIPSTSGTGSEVTNFSVITAEGEKVCIVDDFIAPDIAILDSTCIKHVPQKVIADTGLDVLVHSIEAYVSVKATDFTDALAEKAVHLIYGNLETLYGNPGDSDARDRIQNASCMAGMAFTNSGLGINHSLAHALGGTFHIAHGRSNALLMSAVMEYNADLGGNTGKRVCERYSRLAYVMGLPSRTAREGTVSLMQAVERLKKSLGVEVGIRALGSIDKAAFEAALERMADSSLLDRCTPTNPRKPDKSDLIRIYQKSY